MTATNPYIDISRYLNTDLFNELGIQNLTEEEQARFLEEMGAIIQQRSMTRIFDELSDAHKDELEAIIQANPDDSNKVVEYIVVALPNYETFILEEIALYKKELLDRFAVIQG